MKKTFIKDKWKDLIQSVKDNQGIEVIMCECAFGDTPDELQLMGKRIKEIVNNGGKVHVIK